MPPHALALAMALASPMATPDTVATPLVIHDRLPSSTAADASRSGSLLLPLAALGAFVGGVVTDRIVGPAGQGDYAGLARGAMVVNGAVLGGVVGALVGSRIHTPARTRGVSR
jgi:hypothetical protein